MTPTPKLPRGKGFRRLGRAPKSVLRAYRLTLDPPLILDGVRVDEDGGLRGQRAEFLAARRTRRADRKGATA